MRPIVRLVMPMGLDADVDGAAGIAAAREIAGSDGGVDALTASLHGREDDVDAWTAALASLLPSLPPAMLTLLPASPVLEELTARLAMRLGAAALGRCTSIDLVGDDLVATRDAFGGRAQARLAAAPPAFAAMRMPRRQEEIAATHSTPDIRHVELRSPPGGPMPVSCREIDAGRRRLEGAKVVVSGGRGMSGPEGFAQLEALAASLDAAVGGSLPTVDAGWVPVSHQVGQSGKFVTPELYVAIGISGTPQHLAGIGSETRIVAINKDAQADIFRVAEVGIVGDWREIVPPLVARLKNDG